jgi:hypothetical protein
VQERGQLHMPGADYDCVGLQTNDMLALAVLNWNSTPPPWEEDAADHARFSVNIVAKSGN